MSRAQWLIICYLKMKKRLIDAKLKTQSEISRQKKVEFILTLSDAYHFQQNLKTKIKIDDSSSTKPKKN